MNNTKQRSFVNILIPLFSVLLGMIIGGLVMLIMDYNPIEGYKALIEGAIGSPFYIGETMRQAAPLILVSLGFAVANIAGFFNIGVAGQTLLGWLGSVSFALFFPDLPGPVLMVLSIIVGAIAGALWAGIAGALRAFFGTSEVIVTIMLNYVSLHMTNYVIRNVLTDSADTTDRIPEAANLRMEWLTSLTENSTIHAGIFIAIIMAFVIWFLLKKTTLGFEIRAVGLNPSASRYAGMSTKRIIILSMLISGALAGLGGAMEGMGNYRNIFVQGSVPSVGFDGLAVALLGMSHPIGIIFASLLFALLKIGGTSMPMRTGLPIEIVDIIIAFIIFFVGANYIIRFFIDRRVKKNDLKLQAVVTATGEVETTEDSALMENEQLLQGTTTSNERETQEDDQGGRN